MSEPRIYAGAIDGVVTLVVPFPHAARMSSISFKSSAAPKVIEVVATAAVEQAERRHELDDPEPYTTKLDELKERFEPEDETDENGVTLVDFAAELRDLALELERLGRPVSTRETLPDLLHRISRGIFDHTSKRTTDAGQAIDDAFDLGRSVGFDKGKKVGATIQAALDSTKKSDPVGAWVAGRRKT